MSTPMQFVKCAMKGYSLKTKTIIKNEIIHWKLHLSIGLSTENYLCGKFPATKKYLVTQALDITMEDIVNFQ